MPHDLLSRRAISSIRPISAIPAIGVLAFWVGLVLAARRYPAEYDWRYMTLSSLISRVRNPGGHLWASAGILACSLCGLWWSTTLAGLGKAHYAGTCLRGIRALQLGNFFMACAATVPQSLFPVHKGHEILTLFAFLGLCLGTLQLAFQATEQIFFRRSAAARSRLYPTLLAGAAALPVVLAGLTEAYVYYLLPELPWVNLTWRARGVPVYLSFAFWEWITCVVLSAYVAILPLSP